MSQLLSQQAPDNLPESGEEHDRLAAEWNLLAVGRDLPLVQSGVKLWDMRSIENWIRSQMQ